LAHLLFCGILFPLDGGYYPFRKQNGMCNMVLSVQTKLLHYIDEHLASYLELWNHLAQQVNGIELVDSQQFLTTLATNLQQRDLQNKLLRKQLLYVELRTETPRTLLFYHSASHTQELAHIAALLSALDSCKNVLGFVPVNIQWLIDGSGTKVNLEELGTLQPDGCICYHAAETAQGSDGTPILAPATKGHLCVELQVHTASSTIDSMHGGVAPDALWRLLWALGTLKDAREDILIEGFYDTLAPVQDDVMTQLRSLPDTSADLAQCWGIHQPLMGLQGFQFHYAHLLLPTCSMNNIMSSVQPTGTSADERAGTLLPVQAKAQVDFYLVPNQNPQDIFSKLQSHLQKQGFSDVQVRICSSSQPLSTPVDHPFIQLAISATEKAYEQTPYLLPTTVGSYVDHLPSHLNDKMPIVFMAKNELNPQENTAAFASMIKQIVLLIGGC
jgi:acetylornithine deacetylase/succinyl-diaminopimelate desuccinylase-like protein